jgi:hypothetical protein
MSRSSNGFCARKGIYELCTATSSERWWVVIDGDLVTLAFASDAGVVFGGAGAFA